jgi:SM-20-related protein
VVVAPGFAPGHYTIAEALALRGWCLTPEFIPQPLVQTLRAQAREGWDTGRFKPAAIGREGSARCDPAIRSDAILWLAPEDATPAVRSILRTYEELRCAINQHCYLGLFDIEAHFARYGPGSRYARHLDRFQDESSRAVSCVLYLNENWRVGDGGELRLFVDSQSDQFVDIAPAGGTLITFLSHRFEHEVLLSRIERLSIASWFNTRSQPWTRRIALHSGLSH